MLSKKVSADSVSPTMEWKGKHNITRIFYFSRFFPISWCFSLHLLKGYYVGLLLTQPPCGKCFISYFLGFSV